jgi:ribosomal protein S18 acetylase RimI-like enzyme
VAVVVRLADRGAAQPLAVLHLDAALAGYGHIFPVEAPPPTPDEVLEQWEHWLGADWDAGRRAFVAEEGIDAVGVVLAGPDPAEPTSGHVARLYVRPDRWGARIGSALYAQAIAHLTESGFPEATLWVLEHNLRARRWYERLGWHETGERKPVYAPAQIDDLRYRISLGR